MVTNKSQEAVPTSKVTSWYSMMTFVMILASDPLGQLHPMYTATYTARCSTIDNYRYSILISTLTFWFPVMLTVKTHLHNTPILTLTSVSGGPGVRESLCVCTSFNQSAYAQYNRCSLCHVFIARSKSNIMLASSLLILCVLLQVYYTSISVCEMNSYVSECTCCILWISNSTILYTVAFHKFVPWA